MTSYYVMAPADLKDPVVEPHEADRLTFIPDGFSWSAFVLSVFWLLWHRMWLVLLGYLVATLVLQGAASFAGQPAALIALWLAALLLGLEGNGLRRWTMERRGWKLRGLVNAADSTEAELRYFSSLQAEVTGTREADDLPPAPIERPRGIVPRIGTERVVGMALRPEIGK